uniref:Uncharacterized protein n=1 Tax=Arundo donax TaxID=35708 RepID=A0A0A8YRT9_ARUDO
MKWHLKTGHLRKCVTTREHIHLSKARKSEKKKARKYKRNEQ